jgi:hypothetical protein
VGFVHIPSSTVSRKFKRKLKKNYHLKLPLQKVKRRVQFLMSALKKIQSNNKNKNLKETMENSDN